MFEFNDKLGNRSLKHLNLIIAKDDDDNGIIFKFDGESIPGIVRVVREDYTKNGKWSHKTWTVAPIDGVHCATISQDWETGNWINSLRWAEAVQEFRLKLYFIGIDTREEPRPDVEDSAIVRFIRAVWPKIATELDQADRENSCDGSTALRELIAAQQELADLQAEVSRMEADQIALTEADAIRKRVASAREAMKKGASLADLKALLG